MRALAIYSRTIVGSSGQILWERWNTEFGSTLDTLRNDPDFPANPDASIFLTSFASVDNNQADTFGQRIRGLLYPPTTGQYTFWVSSDDQGELWLSSDDSPTNLALIANVIDFTLGPNDWTRHPEQQSVQITLQAGQAYFIEALAQEGGNSDHLAVAWQVPGGSLAVIGGQYLAPPVNNPPVANDDSVTIEMDASVVINVLLNDADVDGDGLSVVSVTEPSHGIASINLNQSISYTPTIAFIGTDSFAYTIDDGHGGQSTATVTVIVTETLPPPSGGGIGQILWQRWETEFGSTLDTLRNDPDFPDNPDTSSYLTSFISAVDQGDTFGQRIRGLVYPPITGQYTFWISSDNQGELWFGNDTTPANLTLISTVLDFTFGPTDWTRYPSQQSALITLQTGEAYFIEALAQEGGGGDYLAVAWQIPGGSIEVIDG